MEIDERGAAEVTSAKRRRCKGDKGAAVVEMALVGGILFMLIFGIVAYGWAMGFRQNLVQAAAEGARAGAVAPSGVAVDRAREAVNKAAGAFGSQCGSNGLACSIVVGACSNSAGQCITVTLTYDYRNHSKMANIPLFGAFLPDTMTTESVAEVNL